MTDLSLIYEILTDEESTMILIVNNNSRTLLDILFNKSYTNYNGVKRKISTTKGLFKRLIAEKNKLLAIDTDLYDIQFKGGSNKKNDLTELKDILLENNSKILCKTNLYKDKYIDLSVTDITLYRNYRVNIRNKYNVFDTIILIDYDDNIKIISSNKYKYIDNNLHESNIPISLLIRKEKIKKLNNIFK